jgi:hypothetical protein
MKPLSKTLAVLLLGALTAGSAATQLFPAISAPRERPTSCHEDGRKVPAPQPASHRCCQIGHQPAILQQAFSTDSGRLPARILPRMEIVEPALAMIALDIIPNLLIPTGDPPGLAPLRI